MLIPILSYRYGRHCPRLRLCKTKPPTYSIFSAMVAAELLDRCEFIDQTARGVSCTETVGSHTDRREPTITQIDAG